MLTRAIEKIKAEMAQNKTQFTQVVGDFLLTHLMAHPADVDKIMAEGKTIAKSLEAMRTEASKKKTGNYAVLAPSEGFAIVLKYFGIDAAVTARPPVPPPAAPPVPKKSAVDFDVSLDDLLK
ncbi:MAG: hypothetical protein P4N59_07355 [Negativicutes bacterium]|nr:hypothetical protein [Negativicutes bacterium]